MNTTPFPARPNEVVALTVEEFMFDLDMDAEPAFDRVCNRFADDANRVPAASRTFDDECGVAASFVLNDEWEFDAAAFCSALRLATSRNGRRGPPYFARPR